MNAAERCKKVWNQMGVAQEKQDIMLANLNSEFVAHPEMLSDEGIRRQSSARLLFWDLGSVLFNYLAVCEKLNNS